MTMFALDYSFESLNAERRHEEAMREANRETLEERLQNLVGPVSGIKEMPAAALQDAIEQQLSRGKVSDP